MNKLNNQQTWMSRRYPLPIRQASEEGGIARTGM
jgi:hypothetical protein